MTSVRRALALTFFERYLTVLLALASNIILARLLTPDQIGMYSVSLAAIGIAHVLREFGIGNYLIQERELTEPHIRTAFGLSLMLGGSLFLLLVLAAPYIAAFYREQAMATTLRIVALNFLVLPFSTVAGSLLRRDMQFRRLVPVALLAAAASFATTVALAWAGMGADSMAVGSVVQNLLIGIGNWWVTPQRRIRKPGFSEWRRVLSFGGQSTMTNVVTTVAMDANDLVVGKVLGFPAVAILSRAQGLMNLFHRDAMNAVRAVAMPAFAQGAREGEPMAERFLSSVTMVTLFAWPFYGWVSLYPLEALRLLFGPQWDVAAPLVPLFCLAGAIASLSNLVPTLLTAVGRIDLVTRVELVVQPVRLALIVAAALVYMEMSAVAWAYLIVTVLSTPIFLWVADKGIPGILKGITRAILPSGVVAGAALLPAVVHISWAGWHRPEPLFLPTVLLVVATGAVLAVFSAEVMRHPIVNENWYLAARSRLIKRRTA